MPLDLDEMSRIAEAWIELTRLPENSAQRDGKFWSWERLHELIHQEPETAWRVIQIIRREGSDLVLANLAAGPLEDLLVAHGEQFIDRVEALARQDKQFKKLLGATWQNAMSPGLWKRVKAVAGPSW
jgi:hypothetical protein